MVKPKVSVIMATYNHEFYVAKTIQSVLSQIDMDFEFLIIDDGSSDNTRTVVSQFKDSRITFIPNIVNQGACIVTNQLIDMAKGEYIALINSDDYWSCNDKLKKQVEFLDKNKNVGACFGKATFIDKNDKIIQNHELEFGRVFDKQNRTSGEWLRYFFDNGNCLCHPTMMIRKSCYIELGKYNNRLRQLPDFDMWIRLVKNWDIYIFDDVFINFRILPGENASSQTTKNAIRTLNEHYIIACDFFANVRPEQLVDGFNDILLDKKNLHNSINLEIEKTMLLFSDNKWLGRPYKMVALPKLAALLDDECYADVLKKYSIDDIWFQNKMAEVDILLPKIIAEIQKSKGIIERILNKIKSALKK